MAMDLEAREEINKLRASLDHFMNYYDGEKRFWFVVHDIVEALERRVQQLENLPTRVKKIGDFLTWKKIHDMARRRRQELLDTLDRLQQQSIT